MRTRKNREYWAGVIRAFERSGETHAAFCHARDLNVGTFRSWLYEIRRAQQCADTAIQVVPVDIVGPAAPDVPTSRRERGRAETVVLSFGDIDVAVPMGTDVRYVGALVAELRRC
jgi:hypothetical protein